MEKWMKIILMNALKGKKGDLKMAQIDELDFERLGNLSAGFGWRIKQKEILEDKLTVTLEKERVEPETDLSSEPT